MHRATWSLHRRKALVRALLRNLHFHRRWRSRLSCRRSISIRRWWISERHPRRIRAACWRTSIGRWLVTNRSWKVPYPRCSRSSIYRRYRRARRLTPEHQAKMLLPAGHHRRASSRRLLVAITEEMSSPELLRNSRPVELRMVPNANPMCFHARVSIHCREHRAVGAPVSKPVSS